MPPAGRAVRCQSPEDEWPVAWSPPGDHATGDRDRGRGRLDRVRGTPRWRL